MFNQLILIVLVCGILSLIAGVVFTTKAVPPWLKDRKLMQQGQQVQAQIVKQIKNVTGNSRETAGNTWTVTYCFEVPGDSVVHEKEVNINNIIMARKLVEGANVPVVYLPSNPSNTATLQDNIHLAQRQKEARTTILITLFCAIVSAVSLFLVLKP